MNSNLAITDLRKTVEQLMATGVSNIDSVGLISLLRQWEGQIEGDNTTTAAAKQSEEEMRKHQLEIWKVNATTSAASGVELFKSVIEAGQTALRTGTLINAGAAAAILALLGEALKAPDGAPVGAVLSPLGYAWLIFMLGMACAGVATAVRYICQALYAGEFQEPDALRKATFKRRADLGRAIAVALSAGSFVAFIAGSISVAAIFQIKKSAAPVATTAPMTDPKAQR